MANWWLGKNLGVPQGTWKSVGKKQGIGLTEGDLAYQQKMREQRMRDEGIISTPQQQYEMAQEFGSPEVAATAARGALDLMATGKSKKFKGQPQDMVTMSKPMSEWTSDDVTSLQKMLKEADYTDYEGKAIKADGIFGKRTESALRKFQQDKGRGTLSYDERILTGWDPFNTAMDKYAASQEFTPTDRPIGPFMESGLFSDSRGPEEKKVIRKWFK